MARQTLCLKMGENPEHDLAIERAVQLLEQDELVAFPTETVYGLGGNALSQDAVCKIFEAKQRPADNPLIVHIADQDMITTFCDKIPALLEPLARAFWPGPLTLVVPSNQRAALTVTRGLDTVALRVPNHPIALALLKRTRMGLAAPSANISGRPSPTRARHVLHDMNGRIPLILDGGPCQVGIESTVLDLCRDQPAILRPGSIGADQLERVLGLTLAHEVKEEHRSPGTRYRHYCPSNPVLLVMPNVDTSTFQMLLRNLGTTRVAFLGCRDVPEQIISQRADAHTLPALLYDCLREWDRKEIGCIIVEGVHDDARNAIMDRINKAATHVFEDNKAVTTFIHTGGLV